MNWISVRAVLNELPEDFSALHEIFARHGMDATVEHDDPPGMSAYFCSDEDSNRRIAELGKDLMDFGAERIECQTVQEEDWAESWKQFFQPRKIGERFMVKPTWEECGPTDRTIIELDPGQAFGTGEHATTQLCVAALEKHVASGNNVIDVGCGSGILSIAAAKLGANVYSTEIEAPAAAIAAENLERNGVKATIATTDTIPADFPKADVLVANIISATLIRLAPEFARHVGAGGCWIASGIIPANLPDVVAAAEAAGFRLAEQAEDGGWVCVVFRR